MNYMLYDDHNNAHNAPTIKACLQAIEINEGAEIYNLWVHPDFRNQGIASEMLRKLFIKGYPVLYVDDHTDRYNKNHNIYLKHGFTYIQGDEAMIRHRA